MNIIEKEKKYKGVKIGKKWNNSYVITVQENFEILIVAGFGQSSLAGDL